MGVMGIDVDIAVIGGGLSGIYTACELCRRNRTVIVLEARERAGGRILCADHPGFCPDMGPSWYWPEANPRVTRLVRSLGLEGYPQFETGLGRFEDVNGRVHTVRGYESCPASWRIDGGMAALIAPLVDNLPEDVLHLSSPVCEIKQTGRYIRVGIGDPGQPPRRTVAARQVILAIPPRLAAATILFDPDLPDHLTQAMMRMGTWMAGQAKFYALYGEPFWRKAGLSGQAFSQRGRIGEIHDGSSRAEGGPFGFTGFFNIPAAQRRYTPDLSAAIRGQLSAFFGEAAAHPGALYYQDWAEEKYTATEYDQRLMREHPDYGLPAGRTGCWKGRVHFAGSETAGAYGGYLEGALNSAHRTVTQCCRGD